MNTSGAPGSYIEEELIEFKRKCDTTNSASALLFPCGLNEVLMKAIPIMATKHDLDSIYVGDGDVKTVAVFNPRQLGSENPDNESQSNPNLFESIQIEEIDKELLANDMTASTESTNLQCDADEEEERSPGLLEWMNQEVDEAFWDCQVCEPDDGDQEKEDIATIELLNRINNLRSEYNFAPLSAASVAEDNTEVFKTVVETENHDGFNKDIDANNLHGNISPETKGKSINDNGGEIDTDEEYDWKIDEHDDADEDSQKEDYHGYSANEVEDNCTALNLEQSYDTQITTNNNKEIEMGFKASENDLDVLNQTQNKIDNVACDNKDSNDKQKNSEGGSQIDETKLSEKYTSKQYFNSKRRYWNSSGTKSIRKNKRKLKKKKKPSDELKKESVYKTITKNDNSNDSNNISENLSSETERIENSNNTVAETHHQKMYEFDATPSVHIKISVNEKNNIIGSKQTEQFQNEEQIWKTAKSVQKTISEVSSCKTPDLQKVYNFVKDLYSEDRKFQKDVTVVNENKQTLNEADNYLPSLSADDQENNNSEDQNQTTEANSTEYLHKEESAKENTPPAQNTTNSKRKPKKNTKNKKRALVIYRENKKNTSAHELTKNNTIRYCPTANTIYEDVEDKSVKKDPSPIRIKLCTDVINVEGILNDLHRIRQQKDINTMKEDEDIVNILKQINREDAYLLRDDPTHIVTNGSKDSSATDDSCYKTLENQESNETASKMSVDENEKSLDIDSELDQFSNESVEKIVSKTYVGKKNDQNTNEYFFREVQKRLGSDTSVVSPSQDCNWSLSHIPLAIEIYDIPSGLSGQHVVDLYQKVSPTVEWLDSDRAILYLKSDEEIKIALGIPHKTIKSRHISAASPIAILAAIGISADDDVE